MRAIVFSFSFSIICTTPCLDMSIRIFFKGLDRGYNARYWSLPNHQEPFEPLLTDIVVPHSLLFNRAGDRVPKEVTFEQAKYWGVEDGDCALYGQAQSLDGSTKFCLRFILNVEEVMRDRKSLTFRTYVRLLKDARFHSKHLVKAEGLFVPVHYGLWLMETGDWAGNVVCSITQWCGKSWNELSRTDMNTEANSILVGRTLEMLHDYGVTHGGVVHRADFRHLIFDVDAPGLSRDDLFNGQTPCYIVDFAEARAGHACTRRLPVLPLDVLLNPKEVGCAELADVMDSLKFMDTSRKLSPKCETYKALQWYDEYSKAFPDLKRSDVLLGQRAKFYSEMPSLYPELHVSFESPGECSKMILYRDPDWDEETVLSVDSAADYRADSTSPETVADHLDVVDDKLRLTEPEDPVVALP
ncbi:hypothetical protein DFH07DRAFT_220798 [Mycena maculata]|uniref:Uncharacterized protein n=1 Tax=Mycena maculata TaxID=230809 RepID=A0AAD7HWP8_9AGAR|nr:hypothetical protein DFH07DRAFT_220798 [Mycena maculata]